MAGSHPEDPGPGEGAPEAPASLLLHDIQDVGRASGRGASYRHVYDTFYDLVRGFFVRRGYGVEDARDLTQETFLRVYRGSGVFETVTEFKGWLFQIAANVHRNAQRRRFTAKRHAPEESLEEWIEERGAPPPPRDGVRGEDPLDRYLQRERELGLATALQELPPKMRRCYLASLHHGWTHREIAEQLGIAEGTVKAHIFQARKRLAELMRPYLDRRRTGGNGSTHE